LDVQSIRFAEEKQIKITGRVFIVEMQINNYQIDFELENEKTVSDIVNSISDWSMERELVFFEIIIDGDTYMLEEIPDRNIKDVNNINCIVKSRADMVFDTADEGIKYCKRINSFIAKVLKEKELNEADIKNFLPGLDWIIEVINNIVSLLELKDNKVRYKDRNISEYLEDLKNFKSELVEFRGKNGIIEFINKRKDIFINIREIFSFLLLSDEMKSLVIRSIDSPDVLFNQLFSVKDELPGQLKNILDTVIAFQTGKDSTGTKGLNEFVDFIYKMIRTCYQTGPVFGVDFSTLEVNGITLEVKFAQLKDLLNETMEIMENNDFISLTDILEYEIKPSFEDLGIYIDKIIDYI